MCENTILFVLQYIANAYIQFSSVQSLSHVWLFVAPWITISQSSLKLTSIESVMPSSHLILCRPLLLLPPIPPNIRVFSNESTLCMRWAKYWSFSFSISPSNENPGLISYRAYSIFLGLDTLIKFSKNFFDWILKEKHYFIHFWGIFKGMLK